MIRATVEGRILKIGKLIPLPCGDMLEDDVCLYIDVKDASEITSCMLFNRLAKDVFKNKDKYYNADKISLSGIIAKNLKETKFNFDKIVEIKGKKVKLNFDFNYNIPTLCLFVNNIEII